MDQMFNLISNNQKLPIEFHPRFEREGVNFGIMQNKDFYLCISLKEPTKKEINDVKKGMLRFRFYEEYDVILPLACFGVDLFFDILMNRVKQILKRIMG